jgi:hypothetical protein
LRQGRLGHDGDGEKSCQLEAGKVPGRGCHLLVEIRERVRL